MFRTDEDVLKVVVNDGGKVGIKLGLTHVKTDGGTRGCSWPNLVTVGYPDGKCLSQTTVSGLSGILSHWNGIHPTIIFFFFSRKPKNFFFILLIVITISVCYATF